MAQSSKIEWTDATWNLIAGCTKKSEGCKNCYAIRHAWRMAHNPLMGDAYKGVVEKRNGKLEWTGELRLLHERLEQPLRWRKPRMVFVCSMSDLFHESIHWSVIEAVFMTMVKARQHVFQVLTKRADRMLEFVSECFPGLDKCSPHIWLGVTVENNKNFWRVKELIRTPAATRFVSLEPLLGPVDLGLMGTCPGDWGLGYRPISDLLHWVIVGAESGPNARPMDENWVRGIRDQCVAAGVPLFYKQKLGNGRKVSLPELDGRTWDEFPYGETKGSYFAKREVARAPGGA